MSDRISAIDRLRGVVRILMMLDHVRCFFIEALFVPKHEEDLAAL